MPLINTIDVVDRHNRPNVISKVFLRSFFLNDGAYSDPYQVSSVHIFKRGQNLSPSTVLDSDNNIGYGASSYTGSALMVFGVSGDGVVGSDDSFLETNYGAATGPESCSGASGIYRLGAGEFAVVLDGIQGSSLSGLDHNNNTITNAASSTTHYLDVWTVKMFQGGPWSTFINDFTLFGDTFFTLTQPLQLKTSHKLYNKKIKLGSQSNIKIGTELTVENRDIDDSTKNVIKDIMVSGTEILIHKHQEDSNLPSRVLVVSGTSGVDISSDNTIMYNWDTNNIAALSPYASNDLGTKMGVYSVQLKYNLLSEKIVTPLFYINVS